MPTIGCRRAGGGLAGAVFTSNVAEGARLAAARAPDVVIFDGSGAAIPPIDVDRRVLVVGRDHDADAYLNTYRRLISDVVLRSARTSELRLRADRRRSRGASRSSRRARPTSRTSTPTSCTSRRTSRTATLLRASSTLVDADTYLVELKAAAIDVVAEHALAQRQARRARARTTLVGDGLDEQLLALAPVSAHEPAPARRAAAAR